MSELNAFQLWCKEILPVVQAAASGEAIQGRFLTNPDWEDAAPNWEVLRLTCEYRIKPKTIKVNDFDVPEPISLRPAFGTRLYVPTVSDGATYWLSYIYNNSTFSSAMIKRNINHLTKEAAIAHAKALLGIDPNKD